MKPTFVQRCRRFWRAEFLSPKDLLLRAVVVAALFMIAHFVGLREYTSFLSGTVPSPETSWEQAAFLGLVYLILYFAFVLLMPILLLAAFMARAVQCFLNRR